jgi:hypothetical protein
MKPQAPFFRPCRPLWERGDPDDRVGGSPGDIIMSASKQVPTDRKILALKPANKRNEVRITDARGLTIRNDQTGERMCAYRYV